MSGRLGITLDYTDGVRRARRITVKPPTADEETLFRLGRTVFSAGQGRRLRICRMGLVCDRLAFPPAQRSLFPELAPARHKRDRLVRALDEIRARFGTEVIGTGRSLEPAAQKTFGPISALAPRFNPSPYGSVSAG